MVWCAAEPKHCVCQWLTVLWGYRHNECAVWCKVRVGRDGEEAGVTKKKLSLTGMQRGGMKGQEESAVVVEHARGKKRTRGGRCCCGVRSNRKDGCSWERQNRLLGQRHVVCILRVLPWEDESYVWNYDINVKVWRSASRGGWLPTYKERGMWGSTSTIL